MKYVVIFFLLSLTNFAQNLRVVTKQTNYTLTGSDNNSIVTFSGVNVSQVTMTIPFETTARPIFPIGARIYGTSLTNSTILINGSKGVTIISSENSFRSKNYGSKWELVKLSRNVWLLEGDLYSLEMNAFIGDDVVIKAIVDANATGPFTYKWYKNEVLIPDANFASLKLNNIQLSTSGKYYAIVSNSAGSYIGETTTLLVK
jgi:hypothetical protein